MKYVSRQADYGLLHRILLLTLQPTSSHRPVITLDSSYW